MQRLRSLSLSVVLLASGCVPRLPPAEIVIRNGTIYTAIDRQPLVEAVAVTDGHIVFVGSDSEANDYVGPETRVIDLEGNTAVPGFIDSHYHLSGVGNRERTLNLEGTSDLEDFLGRVKAAVALRDTGEWVTGRGWIEAQWPEPTFPTRQDLDSVSPDNPVYLTRADGHAGVANSQAVRLAGVTRETVNPFGGEIMKDSRGEPHGMFLDAAQGLIQDQIPSTTEADRIGNLEVGIETALREGWTTIHVPGGSFAEIERLKRLYEDGLPGLRIYYAVRGPGEDVDRLLEQGAEIGLYDNRLTIRTIKVAIDGALGSRGAWLLEPYADYDTAGFPTQDIDEVYRVVEEALRQGVQVMIHAIGDRANREVIGMYERAQEAVPVAERGVGEPRLRIEHLQIVHPDDLPRLAGAGIIASMEPSHAITDLHFAPTRLGIDRLRGAYAWRDVIDRGVIIAGGSDAPVEPGDPRIEFYAAVARKDLQGFQGDGWHPEQTVSREEALKMFTIWGAMAAFEEDIKGTLEPGKLADITVFSKNIMAVPENEILDAETVMTIVGGKSFTGGESPKAAGVRGPKSEVGEPLCCLVSAARSLLRPRTSDFGLLIRVICVIRVRTSNSPQTISSTLSPHNHFRFLKKYNITPDAIAIPPRT